MQKEKFKKILVWSIFGFICILMLRFIEELLISIIKILGFALDIKPEYQLFFQITPQILIILFWVYLIFVYLRKTDIESLSDNLPITFARSIAIVTLILFILLVFSRFIEEYFLSHKTSFYDPPKSNLLKIKMYILSGLNLVEVAVITIGFLNLIKDKKHNFQQRV
jgi:hypothetical protein